jgi:DNA replication and repair protein RecF
VILRSITTQSFRNLQPATTEFHPRTNLVVGRNGQGKTNLLESIYFLATTKSFRTARVQNVVRFDDANVFVSGLLQREAIERTLSVGQEIGESKRRVLMINEQRVTLSAYVSAMTLFAYSAARLEIIHGAPEERRRFLDRGIASIDPTYLEAMSRYARVLRQRNALLHGGTTAGLDAWDAELVAAGSVLQRARAAYTQMLAEEFARIVAEHGYHVRDVELRYRPSSVGDISKLRRDELRARVSLAGPQRDQLEFSVSGRVAAEVLSGGEQKMIVLFLKFAKLELFRRRFDEAAIFLLDDVDAELDLEILESLLLKMPRETQVFATSAKERFLRSLEAGPHRRLLLENGRVTASNES